MKKLLFMMSVVLFALTACEGPEGPAGPPGEPGLPGEPGSPSDGTEWEVEFIQVRANEWVEMTDDNGDLYYQCIKVPEFFRTASDDLRDWIYNDGSVVAYMFMNYDTPDETQYLLPYVVNWSNAANQSQVETYYFNYTMNNVAFYAAHSGDDPNYEFPQTRWFRVVMNWRGY